MILIQANLIQRPKKHHYCGVGLNGARKTTFQARETARNTGTSVVYMENGDIREEKPE